MGAATSAPGTIGGADWHVRPMAQDDVAAAMSVIDAADAAQVDAGLYPPRIPPGEAQVAAIRTAHARFVQRDGPGAWVAVADGRVVGVAESVSRGTFWGLSMLFVHPDFQSRGVGGRLLESALGHAAGATQRMIQSSPDPRALRRYFLAGLAMHPTAEVRGRPDRRAIPRSLPGRGGGHDDLDLVTDVELRLGRSRTEDVAFGLSDERYRLDVVDRGPGRGWVAWYPGRLVMLGATDDQTAADLVWRYLAAAEDEALAFGLTAVQQWAFAVAHAARLTVRVAGALFVDGMAVPGP